MDNNITLKEKAEWTYKMIQKRKAKKKKQNEAAIYDAVGRAVKRCSRR